MTDVFVDGSCITRHGDSAAGFGVWFGPYHELNWNCPVTDNQDIRGRDGGHTQSAQRAEIQAAKSAIRIARREKILGLRIHSDSQYVLHGITQDGIERWEKMDGLLQEADRSLIKETGSIWMMKSLNTRVVGASLNGNM